MAEPVRVKICGVTRPADAGLAVSAGADAIGVNFCADSPRCVDADTARAIAEAAQGRLEIWGVFVNEDPGRIRELAEAVPLTRVQLHGEETPETVRDLADLSAIKALRVKDAESLARAAAYADAWAVLLDAFAAKGRGGTGIRFNWSLVPAERPWARLILAGGLNPKNVAAAVRKVAPDWVDAASGVEHAPGEKDWDLVQAFVDGAKEGVIDGA